MDQDRHALLGGKLEDGAQAFVRGRELLRPWMQLDPPGPGVEAAASLLDRCLVQVEPHERDQASLAAGRERQGAVVRSAEGGVMVCLVQAEHEGARNAVLGHQRLQLVVVAHHAVDVTAEVEMGVEDVRPGGQQVAQSDVVALDQCLCSVARLHRLDPS